MKPAPLVTNMDMGVNVAVNLTPYAESFPPALNAISSMCPVTVAPSR